MSPYSGPSLSGYSQQRPPSLMMPQIFATGARTAFTSPSCQRPTLYCGHNFLANRVAILEEDYCISKAYI